MKVRSKTTKPVIFDTGHGGIINGIYQTEGKRSPDWDMGVLYEGAANRWIINDVIKQMDFKEYPYYHISPEHTDVSLTTRCNRANRIYAQDKNVYGISMHFNAGGGTGWEIFTSRGLTKSDYIAHEFIIAFEEMLDIRPRLGGHTFLNKDKEANYQILRDTRCPFILIEGGFMDHPEDYKKLWDPEFHLKLERAITYGIERVNIKYGN